MEHYEYMDTIMDEVRESPEPWEIDTPNDEEWPEDLWLDYDPETEDPEWDAPFACDLEMGFDPYLGCYTDDC